MTTSSEWERRLFPEPTDPELRQHAVDIAVERLMASKDIDMSFFDRKALQTRLQAIIELNKDGRT